MQCLERHDTPAVFGWVCVLFCIGLSVVVSGGVTPGPFPNPEAKPTCADGTAPGRVWESKSPPALKLKIKGVCTYLTCTLPFCMLISVLLKSDS